MSQAPALVSLVPSLFVVDVIVAITIEVELVELVVVEFVVVVVEG